MAKKTLTKPRAARGSRPDAREVVTRLEATFPGATTELHFRNAFELLVATVLSAQSTDARVNLTTPALFAQYPDARALAAADIPALEQLLVPTGFFRQKARSVTALSRRLVEEHGGNVPADMDYLVTLPGVGRKTANVVLGHALGVPGLPVDRHVLRVANRIGIATGEDPVKVERQLCDQLPDSQWTLASDCLILHGRRVCRPTPQCPRCVLNTLCRFAAAGARASVPAARRARS
jgi:endonuclease-3